MMQEEHEPGEVCFVVIVVVSVVVVVVVLVADMGLLNKAACI